MNKLKGVSLSEDEENRLEIVGRRIIWQEDNKGFGYLSSSSKHDREKEAKAAFFIARCFQEKENGVKPLVLLIDDIYAFIPETASLVYKTQIFDKIASEQNPREDFAIILTGFSDSEIFTQEILEQVPTQNNAGLGPGKETPFGQDLMEFATGQLRLLIEEEKGDLKAVLGKIVGTKKGYPEEDGKLLLATGLLLQDIQVWQNLWYESKKKGTMLYIVAPMSFHDAMNRLNLGWGHGGIDYSTRASNSLGNEDAPPLEDGVELKNYHYQGLSSEEFKGRIEPILNIFKK